MPPARLPARGQVAGHLGHRLQQLRLWLLSHGGRVQVCAGGLPAAGLRLGGLCEGCDLQLCHHQGRHARLVRGVEESVGSVMTLHRAALGAGLLALSDGALWVRGQWGVVA